MRIAELRRRLADLTRICPSCNISHKAPGYTGNHCLDCFRTSETQRKAEWRENNREKDRARVARYQRSHVKEESLRKLIANRKLKAEVFATYGNKCACLNCPETRVEFLSIDHINGGGSEHRRQLFGHDQGGYRFYAWLKSQGCPKDNFQLLCRNCNAGKSEYGECPHNA